MLYAGYTETHMNAFVLQEEEQIRQIRGAWSELQRQIPYSTLFHSFDLYDIWLKERNPEKERPYLLCYGSRQKLLALLPCKLTDNGRLKLYLSGKADILGGLISGDWHRQVLYLGHIRELITDDDNIKEVEFTNIRKSDPILDQLPLVFRKQNPYIFRHDLHSWLDAKEYDEKRYLKHIPSKLYIKLKKTDSSIDSSAVFFENDSAPFPDSELKELLAKMSKHGIRSPDSYNEIITIIRHLYDLKKVTVAIQKGQNGDILSATVLARLDKNSIMGWIDLYDPSIKRINIKNYLHIIDYASKRGLDFYLGTGLYDYKLYNFAPRTEGLYTFYVSKSPLAGLLYQAKKNLAHYLRSSGAKD